MNLGDLVISLLIVTFVVHAAAFMILAVKRRKVAYLVLTGTFIFLTAIYVVKFEGWDAPLAGTR